MLCDEEGDAALPHALGVLGHHVVAHNLDVAAVGAQQEQSYEMGLRVKRDAVVHLRMSGEEILKNLVIFLARSAKRQVDFRNLDLREVVAHVVAETCLTVVLLL